MSYNWWFAENDNSFSSKLGLFPVYLSYHFYDCFVLSFLDCDQITNLEDFGDFKVVAAIDIGSTSSWYGSSTKDKCKTNPLDIKVDKSWLDSDSLYLPMKTATCILLDTDGNFISLGHKAQGEYAELLLDEKADCYLFFDKFKMELYNNEVNFMQ